MKSAIGTILYSLWLPALVLIISVVRFGIDGFGAWPGLADVLWLFGLAWPAGISLTLAVRLMHRRPHALSRILAYGCAVVLGLVSVGRCNHRRAFRSHWRRRLPPGSLAAGVDNPGGSGHRPGRRRRAGRHGVTFHACHGTRSAMATLGRVPRPSPGQALAGEPEEKQGAQRQASSRRPCVCSSGRSATSRNVRGNGSARDADRNTTGVAIV